MPEQHIKILTIVLLEGNTSMPEQHIKILAIVCGIACIISAAVNWDWFFENWQTKYITRVFGRSATRLLYGLLGVILIVLGLILRFTTA